MFLLVELTLRMTLNHKNGIRNGLHIEKELLHLLLSVCFQILFLHFDPEIDVLTFKMTLNHEIVSEKDFPVKRCISYKNHT